MSDNGSGSWWSEKLGLSIKLVHLVYLIGGVLAATATVFQLKASKTYVDDMQCKARLRAKIEIQHHVTDQITWQMKDVANELGVTSGNEAINRLSESQNALLEDLAKVNKETKQIGERLSGSRPNCENLEEKSEQ